MIVTRLPRTDRVGTSDLLDFFRHLTKPAAVQLLSETLNDAAFAEASAEHMRFLIRKAFPFTDPGFERTTPLGYLQAELVGEKLRCVVATGDGRQPNSRQ